MNLKYLPQRQIIKPEFIFLLNLTLTFIRPEALETSATSQHTVQPTTPAPKPTRVIAVSQIVQNQIPYFQILSI